ncbi:MAG: homogentisate phytyltransferase [Bacteroidia bacterium]
MKLLIILWKFSRPHTIVGSVISICTLYLIVYSKHQILDIPLLIMALIIGICCNIFIVGLNQIADVDIDKINKPNLPIPSGVLQVHQAKIIVYSASGISLAVALFISPYLFLIIAMATFIGWAYSMPPFHLKKHHLTAAIAIATVRGILLNAGGFMMYNYLINDSLEMPVNVIILTIFIIMFSIVIAWFKDLPDMEGDAKYNIKSLAILYTPKITLILGHLMVGAAYLFTIYMKYIDFSLSKIPSFQTKVLYYGQIVLFILFIGNAFSIKLNQHQSLKIFYKRFWWFFFAEYLLYLMAYISIDKYLHTASLLFHLHLASNFLICLWHNIG